MAAGARVVVSGSVQVRFIFIFTFILCCFTEGREEAALQAIGMALAVGWFFVGVIVDVMSLTLVE